MSEALQSTGVLLPDGLLPYMEKEKNPKSYAAEFHNLRNDSRFYNLALEYYNTKNNTDYERVKRSNICLSTQCKGSVFTATTHCGFFAAPKGCETHVKYFSSEIFQAGFGCELVVTSCFILDGTAPSPTDCKSCNKLAVLDHTSCLLPIEEVKISWENETPPLSEYIEDLADGVKLSDKAKFRLRLTLLVLAHYNKKNRADYKLVDVLPYALTFACGVPSFIAHCNFIAKRNAPDASNELFFAELTTGKGPKCVWHVIACQIVCGKAVAGCDQCRPVSGKRVIHPTHGYRYGLRPDTGYLRPQIHSETKGVPFEIPSSSTS